MPYRLTRLYTRRGDKGDTDLANGDRVAKNSLRIEALGEIDELNSHLGLLLAQNLPEMIRAVLQPVQSILFELGAELSSPANERMHENDVKALEQAIDALNRTLPPLEEFILPGGNQAAAACHVTRTVCRRAERRLLALHKEEKTGAEALPYLNRLSDLLFVSARILAGNNMVLWKPRK